MNLLVRPRVNNSNKLFHFRTVLVLRILNLREMSKQLKPILEFISLTVLSLSSVFLFNFILSQLVFDMHDNVHDCGGVSWQSSKIGTFVFYSKSYINRINVIARISVQ